jgi:hypothetical protein
MQAQVDCKQEGYRILEIRKALLYDIFALVSVVGRISKASTSIDES